MYFKEHDTASYRMRFRGTWIVFRQTVDPEKEYLGYVHDVDDECWYIECLELGGRNTAYPRSSIEPKYHYVRPGFYPPLRSKAREGAIACVQRKIMRTFVVGFGGQYKTHWFSGNGFRDTPNILTPLKPNVPLALERDGPISNTLLLWKDHVYYLDKLVGFRNKRDFVVDPIFKSEIEDCLRGHECSVKL